jgi:hypothetical protein
METITLKVHVGADGILTLQAPITVTNSDVEVVIVVQQVNPEAAGAAGKAKNRCVSRRVNTKCAKQLRRLSPV